MDLVLGAGKVQHHGANQNDSGEGRPGNFEIGDAAFHVSTAPTEALIRKCQSNLEAGRGPFIVTTAKGVLVAEGLANNAGIADRLELLEVEQFLATNIHELGLFETEQRRMKIDALVARYNEIVDEHETDPSLRIDIPRKK